MDVGREICFVIADILNALAALGDDGIQKSYDNHGGVYEAVEGLHNIADDLHKLKENYS